MPHYTYLIVGGGMAAKAAVTELRSADPNGSIGMITAESELPYARRFPRHCGPAASSWTISS